jgi:hypothetical protein
MLKINLYLRESQIKDLKRISEELDVPYTQLVRTIIDRYLKGRKKRRTKDEEENESLRSRTSST